MTFEATVTTNFCGFSAAGFALLTAHSALLVCERAFTGHDPLGIDTLEANYGYRAGVFLATWLDAA